MALKLDTPYKQDGDYIINNDDKTIFETWEYYKDFQPTYDEILKRINNWNKVIEYIKNINSHDGIYLNEQKKEKLLKELNE